MVGGAVRAAGAALKPGACEADAVATGCPANRWVE